MKELKLKKCPVCGVEMEQAFGDLLHAIHQYNGCPIEGLNILLDDDQIKAWNERPTEDALRADLRELARLWSDLAGRLGLDEEEIEAILAKYPKDAKMIAEREESK